MNHFDWWCWNSYCNAYRLVNKWIRHCPGAAAGLPIKATSTSWNGPWESANITTLSVELRSKRWSKIIRADFTRAWSNVRKRRRRFISWVTSRIVFRRKSCAVLKYQNVFVCLFMIRFSTVKQESVAHSGPTAAGRQVLPTQRQSVWRIGDQRPIYSQHLQLFG